MKGRYSRSKYERVERGPRTEGGDTDEDRGGGRDLMFELFGIFGGEGLSEEPPLMTHCLEGKWKVRGSSSLLRGGDQNFSGCA